LRLDFQQDSRQAFPFIAIGMQPLAELSWWKGTGLDAIQHIRGALQYFSSPEEPLFLKELQALIELADIRDVIGCWGLEQLAYEWCHKGNRQALLTLLMAVSRIRPHCSFSGGMAQDWLSDFVAAGHVPKLRDISCENWASEHFYNCRRHRSIADRCPLLMAERHPRDIAASFLSFCELVMQEQHPSAALASCAANDILEFCERPKSESFVRALLWLHETYPTVNFHGGILASWYGRYSRTVYGEEIYDIAH
jgi:hypothetical protein